MNYPNHYVPILKCKAGELAALKSIGDEIKNSITPLLCIHPVPLAYPPEKGDPYPSKSVSKHLEDVAKKLSAAWGSEKSVIVDFDLPVDALAGTAHYLTFFFDLLLGDEVKLIPTYGPDRDGDDLYLSSLKSFVPSKCKELCIRLTWQDVELYGELNQKIIDIMKLFSINEKMVHIVFDVRSIEPEEIDGKCEIIVKAINSLSNLNEYKSLTVSAAGIPKDMSKFKASSENNQIRSDYKMWGLISDKKPNRKPLFSDYCIVNPDAAEVDPRKMSRSARIRYTTDKDWLILKGKGYKKSPASIQNHELSKALITHKKYMGEGYSVGDGFINKCAKKSIGPGNAQQWVAAESNHHITHVVRQLSKVVG